MRVERENRGSLVIRLFGSLAIEDGARTLGPRDLGGARPKQVLEILLAARGHRVATDRLAELVWPEQRPQNTAASLQTFVSALRRHLTQDRERARELVVTEAEAYRFATDLVDFDLDRFVGLVERSAGEPTRMARHSLEQALALVRGELLEDEPYALWAQDLRGTYQGRVLGARLDAADAALAELDYADAMTHAGAAAALDRFSERAQRTSMLALYALGRQHEALQVYRRFRALIDSELGLEPAAQTRALHSAILRQEDVRALLPRPIERAQRDALRAPARPGRRAWHAGARSPAGARRIVRAAADRSRGRAGKDTPARRARDDPRRRARRAGELLRARAPPSLRPARRRASGRAHRAELSGQHRAALRKIVPELTPPDPPAEFAEIDVLEALVGVLADHAPLVLFLDDLQWAGPATVTALSYLQRRGAPGRTGSPGPGAGWAACVPPGTPRTPGSPGW